MLLGSAMLDNDRRGIGGRIGLGLPECLSGHLVERHHAALGSARRHDQLLAVHQYGFTDAPVGHAAIELLHRVNLPDNLAVGHTQADQIAVGGHRVKPVSISCWRASRAVAARLPVAPPVLGLPYLLASRCVKGHDILLLATL